jgi:ketosteroid isomerase-like protein
VTELERNEIVDSALRSLTAALRRRDADGVLALFRDDAVLLGSEDGEMAVGALELREFLARIFARPGTYGWSGWDPVITGGTQDVLWFVAPATVIVRDDADGEQSAPYRLSGVLEPGRDGRWLFRLFNGAEPVRSADEPRA